MYWYDDDKEEMVFEAFVSCDINLMAHKQEKEARFYYINTCKSMHVFMYVTLLNLLYYH